MANFIRPDEDFERGVTGFYTDVSYRRYAELKAVNASAIKAMFPYRNRIIPAYAKWRQDNPQEESDSLSLGRSAHLALFQPEEFANITIKPTFSGLTKDGKESTRSAAAKEKEAAWLKEHEGDIIDIDEHREALDIVQRCKNTPKVNALLEKKSYNELTGLWTDPATGLLCKIRIDRFITIDGKPAILDVKTTGALYGALPELFQRAIFEYKYHIQKAFYARVVKGIMNLKEYPDSIIIVIETRGAKMVNAQVLDEEWIKGGLTQVELAMQVIDTCIKTGEWWGYPDEILRNAPPKYMFESE